MKKWSFIENLTSVKLEMKIKIKLFVDGLPKEIMRIVDKKNFLRQYSTWSNFFYISSEWIKFIFSTFFWNIINLDILEVPVVVGNGHDDTSSNPGRDWLHFTWH